MEKIAIPVNKSNKVDGHFGHCEHYKVITFDDDKKVTNSEVVDSPQGCGCKSDIAFTLAESGVTIMLAGGIGEGAVNKLNRAGIEVLRGCSGDVDKLAEEYAAGKIADNGSNCNHHDHDHHHSHSHNHNHGSCNHN